MTDATVDQQGESRRRREHPEAPQAADSSTSSSSSESSTDTEMGLVDVCTILRDNSEAVKRERVAGKPVAVFAEGREGGPVTFDLTKWDFNKADCRNKLRKLEENSRPLLLNGPPVDCGGGDEERARGVLNLAFICELCETQLHGGRYFLHADSHSADSREQPTVGDFMNRFPDTFQTMTDKNWFGPDVPHGTNTLTRLLTKLWMRCTGTQLADSLVHCAPNDQECNVPAIAIRPGCRWNFGSTAAFVRLRQSWTSWRLMQMKNCLRIGKQRTMSRRDHLIRGKSKLPVKRQQSICGTWSCTSTPLKLRHGHELDATELASSRSIPTKGSAEAPRYRSRLVCTQVRHKGVEPIFSATPRLETLRILLSVACQEDVFRLVGPFLISIADVSTPMWSGTSTSDYQTRTPRQSSQVCAGNCERTMCGSLDAAQRWGEHCAQRLEDFPRGVASPCHFFHKDLETYILGAR